MENKMKTKKCEIKKVQTLEAKQCKRQRKKLNEIKMQCKLKKKVCQKVPCLFLQWLPLTGQNQSLVPFTCILLINQTFKPSFTYRSYNHIQQIQATRSPEAQPLMLFFPGALLFIYLSQALFLLGRGFKQLFTYGWILRSNQRMEQTLPSLTQVKIWVVGNAVKLRLTQGDPVQQGCQA